MAIIKKYNAKNNTTYVYDSVSYWDKDLKQPRSKRKLIGKIDPVTGEIVPTAGRGRKPKKTETPTEAEQHPVTVSVSTPELMDTVPASLSEEDIRVLYEECRSRLLKTEAELAKAEGTVNQLTKERQELKAELEKLLRRFSH